MTSHARGYLSLLLLAFVAVGTFRLPCTAPWLAAEVASPLCCAAEAEASPSCCCSPASLSRVGSDELPVALLPQPPLPLPAVPSQELSLSWPQTQAWTPRRCLGPIPPRGPPAVTVS